MATERISTKVSLLSKQLLEQAADATGQKQYKVLELIIPAYLESLKGKTKTA